MFRNEFRRDWGLGGLWKIIWWSVGGQNPLTCECESGSQKAGAQSVLKSLLLRWFQHSRILPLPSGPSTDDPCFPLLLVEVFAPWILPLSSSWVLLQFHQPSLILGQCRSQMKFSRAFVQSVYAWTACVVCDIVCRLRDLLESISAVPWFFKSVSLCTCPVSPSYKTNFQRHFLYTANSVVIVTVTSVNVSHCCSL